MSTSDTGSQVPETTGAAPTRRSGNRRILKLAIWAAALLTAGSILMAFVERAKDAADRLH